MDQDTSRAARLGVVFRYELCAVGPAPAADGELPDKALAGITVERGQLVTSRSILSRETGLSEREVRTAMSKLEKSDFLTIRATSSYTIVTICNYEKYQSFETADRPACGPTADQDAANCRPGADQPSTTTEECKKVRREEYTHTVGSEKGLQGKTGRGSGGAGRGSRCAAGVDRRTLPADRRDGRALHAAATGVDAPQV